MYIEYFATTKTFCYRIFSVTPHRKKERKWFQSKNKRQEKGKKRRLRATSGGSELDVTADPRDNRWQAVRCHPDILLPATLQLIKIFRQIGILVYISYTYGCFSFLLIFAFSEGGDPAQGAHAGHGVVGPSLGRWWALVGLSLSLIHI